MNQVLDKQNGTLQLKVDGDVLSTNVDTLRRDIFGAIEGGDPWTTLQLDLTSAKMIDSAGLNLIVSVLKNAKQKNATVTARISSTHIQRTFAFTRLDQQIQVEMV